MSFFFKVEFFEFFHHIFFFLPFFSHASHIFNNLTLFTIFFTFLHHFMNMLWSRNLSIILFILWGGIFFLVFSVFEIKLHEEIGTAKFDELLQQKNYCKVSRVQFRSIKKIKTIIICCCFIVYITFMWFFKLCKKARKKILK